MGALYAAVGIGGVVIAAVTTQMADSQHPSRWLTVAIAMSGLPLVAMAFTGSMAVALVAVAVAGAAWVVGDIVSLTVLQRSLPQDSIARVFGMADAFIVLAMLAGSLVAPVAIDAFGLEGALVASGVATVVLALVSLRPLLSLDQAAEARRLELDPYVRMLERLAVFEGTSRRGLEAMAASAVRKLVPKGTAIVREGDPATAFYVVVEGQLEVWAVGDHDRVRKVGTVGPGEAFGEIGLLAHLPRTATVGTMTDCVIDRIEGEAFLTAVRADDHARATFQRRAQVALAQSQPSKVGAIGDAP